jgi:hypothetical protein
MALSANTVSVQLLDDNAGHVVAKLQFFQHTANAGSHESSVLKINADALFGRTQKLVATTALPGYVYAGDEVVKTSNTAVKGYVVTWSPATNTAVVVLANSAVVFANNDALTVTRTNSTFTVTSSGASYTPAALALRSAAWSVSGNTQTRVALEWVGNPNTEIAQFGCGSGYIGRNNLGTSIPADANAATGSVALSTYATPALSGYTLIVEFTKESGFASRAAH